MHTAGPGCRLRGGFTTARLRTKLSGMDAARIAALLAPFLDGATPPQPDSIATYLDLLLRWNARMNLTAVRDPEGIVTRHFGESLFAAARLFPDRTAAAGKRLIDIGSGAGFPGVPIKLSAPSLALTLIESRQRKATFLREVGRMLRLHDVAVFCGRAEDFPGPAADVVTLRAVERFEDVLPVAARLVRGRLALLIGATQVERAQALLPDFSWLSPLPIPQSAGRALLIGSRVAPSL